MDVLDFVTKNLNPAQKDAVETLEGPLLILAGAGSGKTRVLTHRMANMIGQGVAASDEILCVTFTNKAAKEMEHRIYKILSDMGAVVQTQLWISTFHSFCVRVLRQHITLLDYKPFFGIYDSSDQLSQIKKVMTALDINDKMYPAKNFQSRISSAKMMGLSPEGLEKSSKRLMDQKTVEVYKAYEREMKKANSLDFDDLLLKTYDLFRMYPDVLQMYQKKFRYIMVDEYQDTNHIQYLLVQMLASAHRNLCVVGDEDQSIYSWRGADIKNILDFEKDFRDAKVIKLEENYRSSANIVNGATAVIKNNSQRKDKTLFTSNDPGDLIHVREEKNEYEEGRFVAKTIQSMMNEGEGSYNDYAIFYRTNAQSRVLEEQLRTMGIPYRLVGGVRFYERMEIKDMISYLKLSINPADDIALKRIINVPARGIGKTTIEKIEEYAAHKNLSMFEAAEKACEERLFNAGTTGKIRRFIDLMKDLQQNAQHLKLLEFFAVVLDRTEYLAALKKDESPESQARIENLEELDNAIAQFVQERGEESTLISFLEEMALVNDVDSLDQEQNSVTMMTLHISKGLEYPYVFVVGLEENLFPSARSAESDNEQDVEEERRLAYVGMTRARQKLWLTYAKMRRVWGQEQFNPPSRFIKEIPQNLIDFKTSAEAPRFMARYGSSSYDSDFGGTPKWGATSSDRNRARTQSYDDAQDFPDYENDGAGSAPFSKGMRVRHPTFGVGTVYATEGTGENFKVSVMFTDNTVKKFVVKYARLERV
ncbi:UvrD-helicase domain-containing protein [Bdellovibrio bacteriovorus]|uniref:DNA 3'-5' helicase n=1 Tax=Bdellovibrio bacteriovorus (strain ATCC 15356 / DSM 50701 / NCIMB 9529 / HD100) TaxID=264462 RepID=Q6MI36_BDEBA|nr:UvrD-helicase domain-containing protein [Bdellovibrio bacteriovorus]AHZ83708.1 ATP-dependent DNA helicase [Bdellovibrio bacteriovorus]BEV69680.1 ATP-dependent DNA helicase PcrA [Bdellovibrio bacteriovorus]CAE78146.1 ATP-dependent DNA helicase [Bdellovibrio bacteriovorus HD100]